MTHPGTFEKCATTVYVDKHNNCISTGQPEGTICALSSPVKKVLNFSDGTTLVVERGGGANSNWLMTLKAKGSCFLSLVHAPNGGMNSFSAAARFRKGLESVMVSIFNVTLNYQAPKIPIIYNPGELKERSIAMRVAFGYKPPHIGIEFIRFQYGYELITAPNNFDIIMPPGVNIDCLREWTTNIIAPRLRKVYHTRNASCSTCGNPIKEARCNDCRQLLVDQTTQLELDFREGPLIAPRKE